MKHCFFFNRQEMNRLFYPSLLLLLIVFLVSGCSYSVEDDHAGEPVGLTVSPTWRDNTDDTAHVACLDVWVYSEDEQLILHRNSWGRTARENPRSATPSPAIRSTP